MISKAVLTLTRMSQCIAILKRDTSTSPFLCNLDLVRGDVCVVLVVHTLRGRIIKAKQLYMFENKLPFHFIIRDIFIY